MCGINGIFDLGGAGDFSSAVIAMNSAIAHRGPDDEGTYSTLGLTLGHRRLSIIDLSSAGHQPMYSKSGKHVVVFNGEIYNFKEVKESLTEVDFETGSDTEVLLAAWEKWGVNCLSKFNGMFAFAIWNIETTALFLVRDRLGIKPLYTYIDQEHLIFSSEIRGLLASDKVPRKIDEVALEEYVKYQTVHAPRTILQNVKMLMPGHFMKVSKGEIQIHQWWKPEFLAELIPKTYAEVCSKTRTLFKAAVERRLVADVPFGAFLSGGIDSTVVTGMMNEVLGGKVQTFNVSFDNSDLSEAVFARIVAKKFNTEHHEIVLTPQHFLNQLPDALNAMDHPSGDGPNTYVVAEATKNAGITMALSGLGGDELFAGYDIFKRAYSLQQKQWLNKVPKFVRFTGGSILKTIKPGVASEKVADVLAMDKMDLESFYPKSREVLNDAIASRLIGKSTDWKFPLIEAVYGKNSFPSTTHFLSHVSLAEIGSYMQNTLLRDADQMSMAHALEVRVPFLDYELVNYVLNVPDQMKYPTSPKKLLVDSMKDLLPNEIVNRPKMGFTFPWKDWMKEELRDLCIEHLNYLGDSAILSKSEILNLWNRFLEGDVRISWSRIWHLVVLGHWMKKNGIAG